MAAPGVSVSVTVDGTRAASAALRRLLLAGTNMQRPLAEIGAALLTSTQRRFEDEAGPDGAAWEKSARAQADGGATLRDTARLYQSLTYMVHPRSVEVGTNTLYAAIHQLGGDAGRGHSVHLPARPYLGLDTEDEREIQAIVNDHLFGALR